MLKLIDKYDLLSAGGKPVNVAADRLKELLKTIASPDFMDGIADRAEKIASGAEKLAGGVERGIAAFNRIAGTRESRAREPRRRRAR